MKARILGCGTSSGVPRIGNDWGACDPEESRNRRLRSSILVEQAGEAILVDCGPDMRAQLLSANVGRIDRLIVTHDHADHCHGIDDLRQLAHVLGHPIPLHSRSETIARLGSRFRYAFEGLALYRPIVESVAIEGEVAWENGGARLDVVDQPHGGIFSLGLKFAEAGRTLAYGIDFHKMTDAMASLYEGSDVWIADCLRREPHPTHAHLDAVVGWARELGVGRLILTHLDTSMDYASLVRELPDWAEPGHDGMEIGFE